MIYRINESSKSDDFIKTMPKKIPTTKEYNEKLADKRFDDWHKMSDKEKREVLNHLNTASDNKHDSHVSGTPSKGKYYNANYNTSIKVRDDKMIPDGIRRESTIFESVEFI
jgi:hypothetical protein